MSKLEELINELCPDGVEYKPLGELGEFYGGLSGKSKEDFTEGNAKFISYMNIFTNLSLNIDVNDNVKIKENEKQNTVQYGDILFTGSSETPEECGMSSVLTTKTNEFLFLNSFCFGFRTYEKESLLPDFSKYLFRSEELRKQIKRTASGVTRFNVSKKKMAQVVIPLPPLPVQREIVRILDNFTELTAELTAELTSRKKQYDYYCNLLLNFEGERNKKVPWISLGEVCIVQSGGTPSKAKHEYWENGEIKWLGSTVCQNQKKIENVTNYISELGLKKSSAKIMKNGTTLIALVGATIGKIAFLTFEAAINQNIAGVYPKDTSRLNPSYLFYACGKLYDDFTRLSQGKLAMANLSFVRGLKIPIPPLEEQERIVSILDRFDTLCNDLTSGLPAEIEARRKQYEYYRDKLLTFKEAKA